MRTIFCLSVLVMAAGLVGCNIVTPVAFVLSGGPKVDAVAGLEDRPTVIFIDDRDSKLPRRSLRANIGKAAETLILKQKLISEQNMISSQSALRAVGSDSVSAPISAVDVGRRVGAQVVIFVEMQGWTLARVGSELSPAAQASVKLLDCVSNERIWPDTPEGYELIVQMPRQPGDTNLTRADRARWEEMLANQIGTDLAGMFYTHDRTQMQDQRNIK